MARNAGMEAVVKTSFGTVKVTGEDQAAVFEAVASTQEVFGQEPCGRCGCTDSLLVARTNQNFSFYERHCQGVDESGTRCGAYLTYGQKKDGGFLFPVRKVLTTGPEAGRPDSQNGEYDARYRGWTKYRGPAAGAAAPADRAVTQSRGRDRR